jgi:hypothetical protein
MSPGTNKAPIDSNDYDEKNHLLAVSPWIILNKNLTLKEMEEFFTQLNYSVEKK